MRDFGWLACLCIFITFGGKAQVKNLGIVQGLSSNYVLSISQDHRGLLWFATEDGLNRFNGNAFQVYKKAPEGMSANELNRVFTDPHEQQLWIATQRAGLLRYDLTTETFKTFKNERENPNSLITNDVTDISAARDGNLWISTYHRGVEYLNKKSETFTHYNSSTVEGLPDDKTWTAKEDQKGNLYIGQTNEGLSIISLKDKKVRRFKNIPGDPQSLPGNTVRAIFFDQTGNAWIGTSEGLALFDEEQGKFTVFRHDPNRAESLSANYVYSIGQLADGRLWIGTEKGGLNLLNLKKNMFSSYSDAKFDKIKEFHGLTIRTVFQDKFQNIWLGSYGGGVLFMPHRKAYFETWSDLRHPTAWGMTVDRKNQVWVGTDGGGIDLYKGGQFSQNLNKNHGALRDDAILAATRDRQGNLWFGTFRGGAVVFSSEGKFLRHVLIQGRETDIRCFFEAESMWIGSSSGLLETGSNRLWTPENSDLPSNQIRTGLQDKDGHIWLGFFGEGLVEFNQNLKTIYHFNVDNGFPSNTVNHLLRDRNGELWVATGEGLVHFHSDGKFRVYNEQDGIHNSHIRAIAEDRRGNIWVSTVAGISKLERSSGKIYNYWQFEGVPRGDFMSGSVTTGSDGRLYFGSQQGVCTFVPEQVPTHMELPHTVITDFMVYRESHLQKSIPLSNEVVLPYGDNTFTINFNSLDYSLQSITEYSYLLKGLNDNWYDTQGANAVTFRNLPPGNYTLQVRSGLQNQGWSKEITTLDIVINPPFWASWWAKILYIALASTLVAYVLRFYARKMELENSLFLEKRDHQKDQELHKERIRFFTNITHELRTPLTLILGPLEDLLKEKDLTDKHKGRVAIIHKSSVRLLSLINQLLDFQKTQSQLRKLTVAKGDLRELVAEMGKKYEELNINSKINFQTDLPTALDSLYFDEEVVNTVLENLLSNAFKYTQSGQITLSMKELKEEGKSWVEIVVADTGKGIPIASIPKIFDRYYQVEEDSHVSGTGIGLALVQSLVKLHEGQIFVESEPGIGSVFRFRLQKEHSYNSALHQERIHLDSSERNLILVIEDNDDLRQYIVDSLSAHFTVISARNGAEGLDLAREHMPDLVISDVMMPLMDGMKMTRHLREDIRTSHIPVVFLTAKDGTEERIEGYGLGIASYLTKPFSADLILARIENILETRRKPKEEDTSEDGLAPIDREFLDNVKSRIQENLELEKLDVDFLASGLNMSHSTLYRKIKGLTGGSVNEFIRKVRMQKAEELLRSGQFTVSEVAFRVGIASMVYFRQCFKEEFGKNPSEYLKKKGQR
jgi:signal transduction histidine kinase/ligand-binding sensor domain-containing protein/DNA-binding response OmpR family regulator